MQRVTQRMPIIRRARHLADKNAHIQSEFAVQTCDRSRERVEIFPKWLRWTMVVDQNADARIPIVTHAPRDAAQHFAAIDARHRGG